MISLAILAATTALGHWVLAARIAVLRASMQVPIDQISPNDERRIAFDSLHRYSVLVFAVAICAAAVVFILIALELKRPERSLT